MPQNEAQLIQQLHDHVVAKSMQDPAFRASFVANPRAAVEKELNTPLPAHIKLNVVESPANTMTIVLPHVSAVAADGELSDSDLEAVAGGSKSGATSFFEGVGKVITDNPVTIGSAVGGVLTDGLATIACGLATTASGQR